MYNLELFVIAVYCLIADLPAARCLAQAGELYPDFCQTYGKPRRAGFDPVLTDLPVRADARTQTGAECLTIELVGHFIGYPTQKQLYEQTCLQRRTLRRQVRERFGAWFPNLKDRTAFLRQSANLWRVKAVLHHLLVQRLGGHQAPCQIIDTLPIPICHLQRRWRRKIFKTDPIFEFPQPTKGYCAAKKEAYFGFKGGLRITKDGLIVHAPLLQAYLPAAQGTAQAGGHDSRCRDLLLEGVQPDTFVLGDTAFLDLDWQEACQQRHQVRVLTPIKSNMKPTPQRKPFILSGVGKTLRRLIETVYLPVRCTPACACPHADRQTGAQLTQRFQVVRMKVRDAWHLQNLWTTKILAHTVCVFLNIQLQRDPLDFEGLVRF